jgi:hypothetical protein
MSQLDGSGAGINEMPGKIVPFGKLVVKCIVMKSGK